MHAFSVSCQMSDDPPGFGSLALIQAYQPRSFRERGLAPFFTTPLLSGARVRGSLATEVLTTERVMGGPKSRPSPPSAADAGSAASVLEVMVPNPSGGRGVYILPWSNIGVLCRPTMHDTCLGLELSGRLARRSGLTPAAVRDAGRQMALQGLAGRTAARAAQAARTTEVQRHLATRNALLSDIIIACEPAENRLQSPLQEAPAMLEQRGMQALGVLASRLQTAFSRVRDGLEFIAASAIDIGLGAHAGEASIPRLCDRLIGLSAEMQAWAQGQVRQPSHLPELAPLAPLTAALQRMVAMAQTAQAPARALLRDVPALMRMALARPQDLSVVFARPWWILDGWEHVALPWQSATTDSERIAAIAGMAARIPILPEEIEAWLNLPAGTAAHLNPRGSYPVAMAPPNAALSRSSTIDRIAHTEKLRAEAL